MFFVNQEKDEIVVPGNGMYVIRCEAPDDRGIVAMVVRTSDGAETTLGCFSSQDNAETVLYEIVQAMATGEECYKVPTDEAITVSLAIGDITDD